MTLYAHEMAAGVDGFILTLYVGVEGFLACMPMKWPPGWKNFYEAWPCTLGWKIGRMRLQDVRIVQSKMELLQ